MDVASDACLDQIHSFLNDTISPTLKAHSIVISSLVNAIHKSEASDIGPSVGENSNLTSSGGAPDDDTSSTGSAYLASLKPYSNYVQDFFKARGKK